WLCKCDCGNETVAFVNNLNRGTTTSCGCDKGIGKRTTWTDERDELMLRLLNEGVSKQDVSKAVKTSVGAVFSRLHQLKGLKNIIRCPACGTYFKGKTYNARFCSDRCRWRYNKNLQYTKRRQDKVCVQCGK